MVAKGMLMNIVGLAGGAWFSNNKIIDEIQNIDTDKIKDEFTNLALAAGSILAVKFLKLKGMLVPVAYVAAGYFLGQAIHGMQKAAAAASYGQDYGYIYSDSNMVVDNPYSP